MDNEEIRPSQLYYALAGAVFVGGWAAFAAVLFLNLSSLGSKFQQVVVPGKASITLPAVGTYTISYEYRSVVGNKIYSTARELSGLECVLTSKATGVQVPLSAATSSGSYEIGGRAGTSVFDFKIQYPGVYELSASYPESQQGPEVVLAVGHDFTVGLITTIFGSLAIVFGSMGLALAITIITVIKRSNAKKRLKAVPA